MCLRMEIAPPSQRRKVAAKNEQEDHEKIEKLELQIKDLQIEVAFVREEAAQECSYPRASASICRMRARTVMFTHFSGCIL